MHPIGTVEPFGLVNGLAELGRFKRAGTRLIPNPARIELLSLLRRLAVMERQECMEDRADVKVQDARQLARLSLRAV